MCSMMSEIPLKKSLNTISYQISEEIENILLNEKGEPKLDATVKRYHIWKKKKKSPLQCLGASLSHSIGMKNCVLQRLHWVDGHSLLMCNKTIKLTSPFHISYDHRISRASQTNRDNIFSLLYQCNFVLTTHFLKNHRYLVVKVLHPGRVH